MAQSAVNSGLESLAAEASRRAESFEAQAEAGHSAEANGSKSASQSSGQKGKVRKAYTITKQRERWTDSEHERFLQALKRYGRAWRKIEEHIGTKTAVQIRSHAQKFFSKLQREQSANGGLGDESSKAGISIPPPRPKRKPMHPYPKKTNDSHTDNGSSQQQQTPQQQPPAKQPGSSGPNLTPGNISMPSLPALEGRSEDLTVSQVLEAAAAAAASAWSQVVASAGCKVQQQLQQGLQSMQPLLGMNPALLYQVAAQQQQHHHQPLAANLQSSSQHPMGRSPFLRVANPELQAATASAPHQQAQAQSMQDSPDGAGNAADQGNDRDSACSKEYSRGRAGIDHAPSTGRQTLQRAWPAGGLQQQQQQHLHQQAPDARLNRAWELMTQSHAAKAASSQWGDPLRLANLTRMPSRAFSAGPILHAGGTSSQQVKQEPAQAPNPKGSEPESARKGGQSCSDTSQLARFYQQAAEEQQAAQDAENNENGSSGEGGGSSGDGDGSNGKLGLLRSDKGSNTGNSGSDEDANGNGSGSRSEIGAIDTADVKDNDGKGSDEGSNSPRGFTRNNSPVETEPQKGASGDGKTQQVPSIFKLGIDQARLAAASAQLQDQQQQGAIQQPRPVQAVPAPRQPVTPAVLPGQAFTALQQQALSAWASSMQQQVPNGGYQLLHGLISNLQAVAGRLPPPMAAAAPTTGLAVDTSMGERKSSGVPSMDTFNANSSRSFSVPLGVATGSVCSQDGAPGSHLEEGSGFKPYNKRFGASIAAEQPPAKRFALAPGATLDKPKPVSPLPGSFPPAPGMYSPFDNLAGRSRQL